MSSVAPAVRAPQRLSSGCAFSLRGCRLRTANHAALPLSPRAQGHDFIKGANAVPPGDVEVFAKVEMHAGDLVADLAECAWTKFPRWGADAGQVRLYLVKNCGKENPTADEEATAVALVKPGYALTDVGIASGSWLIAWVSLPAAAAGASCGAPFLSATAPYQPRRPISQPAALSSRVLT